MDIILVRENNKSTLFINKNPNPMKKVILSPEEWLRLRAVSLEEKMEVVEFTAAWVTWYMKKHNFSRDYGPLSDQEMGGQHASKEIAKIAYAKIFGGKVHWDPKRSLSSQMIYTAYSVIGHLVRDFYDKGKDMATPMYKLSEPQQAMAETSRDLDRNPHLREFGYFIAREVVKDQPQLLAYLDALYEEHCYEGIRRRLHISMKKVMELEEQLLNTINNR